MPSRPESGWYLFRWFGFTVRLDSSWIFLAVLVAWSLAVLYFPFHFKGLSSTAYWLMGLAGAVGLFFSIILHELCHSLVGRHYGLPITGIKLFIFGGVAEMGAEPPNAKSEFLMAIAGPVCSVVLGIISYLIFRFGLIMGWPLVIIGIFKYLGFINLALAAFNLLPGFPLDGGRVLRSILWWWKCDFQWATRVAAQCGSGVAIGLMIWGILLFIFGAFLSGLWLFLIGLFLNYLAKQSYQQFLMQKIFADESVRRYAKTNLITVSPTISVQALVEEYFYHYFHKLYPVVLDDTFIGCISMQQVKALPRERWPDITVRELMLPVSSNLVIDAQMKVTIALQKMYMQQQGRLLVTDQGKLYGVIALKDLMEAFQARSQFEEGRLD